MQNDVSNVMVHVNFEDLVKDYTDMKNAKSRLAVMLLASTFTNAYLGYKLWQNAKEVETEEVK